jgi:ABC-type lipoprotein release transport system permease subunit
MRNEAYSLRSIATGWSEDAVALAGLAALLTTVACVASYLPARRVGRIDPVAALRSE